MLKLNKAQSFDGNEKETAPTSVRLTYNYGASFVGKLHECQRTGIGLFTWSDGSTYNGSYLSNLRHGKGVQTWPNNARYEGIFAFDLRQGKGTVHFANGQMYTGDFFKDRKHGKGIYNWPDGSSFTGRFYMDKKEGYGIFVFADGRMFRGLYRKDERYGPGVLSYADGTQDVGLWQGERLFRLSVATAEDFYLAGHLEFHYQQEEDDSVCLIEEQGNLTVLRDLLKPPSLFDYAPEVTISDHICELYCDDVDSRSLAVNSVAFENDFLKSVPTSFITSKKIMDVWNKSPFLLDMQKHIHKHRWDAHTVDICVDKVLRSNKSESWPRGQLNLSSDQLIRMAIEGNSEYVEKLLSTGTVHPDVADSNGYTALIMATIHCDTDTINVLLDNGASINQLSDGGVSALAAGFIHFYNADQFLENVAECRKMMIISETEETLESVKQREANIGSMQNDLFLSHASAHELIKTCTSTSDVNAFRDGNRDPALNNGHKMDYEHNEHRVWDGAPVAATENSEPRQTSLYQLDQYNGKGAEADDSAEAGERWNHEEAWSTTECDDFESNVTLHNYHIEVTQSMVERCAEQLSSSQQVVSRQTSDSSTVDMAQSLAMEICRSNKMKETLRLLLRRGADANASMKPMPVLFFAVKVADVDMVRSLLMQGSSTCARLNGLTPLHIAVAIPGQVAVEMTKLLLDALADPDARAADDDSFLNRNFECDWSKDVIDDYTKSLLGGRTPLHIACSRDDNYEHVHDIVRLLLEHRASPDLMCNGFSPLALAIAIGNDLVVNDLLVFGGNPNLALPYGIGSALCVASSTEYEHRRDIQGRILLVDHLIEAGADILAPILIGPKRTVGTAVDYAHYMFNMDQRIAHTPYHALTPFERETFNWRKTLLAHLADILRTKAVERERLAGAEKDAPGIPNIYPCIPLVITDERIAKSECVSTSRGKHAVQDKLKSEVTDAKMKVGAEMSGSDSRQRFKYCYSCGRSVGVKLAACSRCKKVYYCSKLCKLKAWNARHKDECVRVGGRSASPKGPQKKQCDSATLASHVPAKIDQKSPRVLVPTNGRSVSAGNRYVRLAGRAFRTEDGRLVYIDNYSYN